MSVPYFHWLFIAESLIVSIISFHSTQKLKKKQLLKRQQCYPAPIPHFTGDQLTAVFHKDQAKGGRCEFRNKMRFGFNNVHCASSSAILQVLQKTSGNLARGLRSSFEKETRYSTTFNIPHLVFYLQQCWKITFLQYEIQLSPFLLQTQDCSKDHVTGQHHTILSKSSLRQLWTWI